MTFGDIPCEWIQTLISEYDPNETFLPSYISLDTEDSSDDSESNPTLLSQGL